MTLVSPFQISQKDPVTLHKIYGVNCYQHAIGHLPITLHFNQRSGNISYTTLCPGHLAKNLGNLSLHDISAYEAKRKIIYACQEDGLEELEQRSLSEPISIPKDRKMIAFYFSSERKDFDFHVLNQREIWENKTPFADVSETDNLPTMIAGGYILTRLFFAPQKVTPHGVNIGKSYTYPDGTILNLPERPELWERGPSLIRNAGGGYELARRGTFHSAPDLTFLKNAP